MVSTCVVAKHYYIPHLMPADAPRDIALPIDEVVPRLRACLRTGNAAVLQAPPGAGKTTRVPLALLDEPWLRGRRILMLEPRRLATRAAARRMAATLDEPVGATVGFRVRGETRVSAATRIEVVTEGVLTRMLLDDPTLESTGVVLFDEFHERSMNADLGLALTLQTQSLVRPDLRILVMSATLNGEAVGALLGHAPLVTSVGRSFPVVIRHRACRPGSRLEACVADAIRTALKEDAGGVLAFLPGAGEIRRCLATLTRSPLGSNVLVLPLYGDLSAQRQDEAISPARVGVRKVVLATSIAETSLTIEDVRIVVDSGVSRVSRFSPRTGMARLETVRASRSSADQRAGRAGRTAAGVCYRLWPEYEDGHLPEHSRPEILDADLAPLALDQAAAGVWDVGELRWLDAPPQGALSQARALLRQLGALSGDDRITPHGRAMGMLGVHPRLSHMILVATARGYGATACTVAALLEERDIIRRDAAVRDVDLRTRVALVVDRVASPDVDQEALRRVREQARRWRELVRVDGNSPADAALAGVVLALAYPERVAQRRAGAGERYLMRNGAGAVLDQAGALAGATFVVIADVDGKSPHACVYLAAPIDRVELESLFAEEIEVRDVVEWDAQAGMVTAVRQRRLDAIVFEEASISNADPDCIEAVLVEAIERGNGVRLPWANGARGFLERIAFARMQDDAWPDVNEAGLLASAHVWLRPHLAGMRRRSEVEGMDLVSALEELLTWEQRRRLEQIAPVHLAMPTGSHIRVDYRDPAAPFVAVRIQELFGMADTPRLGTVSLTLHLLSPANRPVQVTRDLAGFWRSSYFEVRKDLRGRYPKHEWPEDPLRAAPTRRAKPR